MRTAAEIIIKIQQVNDRVAEVTIQLVDIERGTPEYDKLYHEAVTLRGYQEAFAWMFNIDLKAKSK